MNLDIGVAVNTFPSNFGPEGVEMEVSTTGSQMVKLGNFKDAMKMVCPDL